MIKDAKAISFLDLKSGYEQEGVYFVNFISEDFNFSNKLYKDILLLSPSVMSTTIGYINKHKDRDSCLDCIVSDKFVSLVNRKSIKDKPKDTDSTKCISFIQRFLIDLDIKKIYICELGSGLSHFQITNLFESAARSIKRNINIVTYVNY